MSLKLHLIAFFFLTTVASVISQNTTKIDTSYSVHSSFIKYKKKFPEIEIVKPQAFENVNEKRAVVYKEIGERKLHLDVFYNNNNTLKPAVVLIHGGGWKSGDKSLMKPLAQTIASKGYACFSVEYRLSPEATYPAGIFDVKSAIQYVKEYAQEFKVDTSKVAVLGCSSGGQMAALIGTTNNNKKFESNDNKYNTSSSIQAIIDIDGVLAFKHPDSQEGLVAGLWLGGDFEMIPSVWNEASALTHTNKNMQPILFINSQFERFHAGRDDMIKQLDSFNIYYQIKTIKSSPHTFWLFHPWFKKTVKYITNFLDKTLK